MQIRFSHVLLRWGFVVVVAFGATCAMAQIPDVADGGVLNGASFIKGQAVAPGSLVSIFRDRTRRRTGPSRHRSTFHVAGKRLRHLQWDLGSAPIRVAGTDQRATSVERPAAGELIGRRYRRCHAQRCQFTAEDCLRFHVCSGRLQYSSGRRQCNRDQ